MEWRNFTRGGPVHSIFTPKKWSLRSLPREWPQWQKEWKFTKFLKRVWLWLLFMTKKKNPCFSSIGKHLPQAPPPPHTTHTHTHTHTHTTGQWKLVNSQRERPQSFPYNHPSWKIIIPSRFMHYWFDIARQNVCQIDLWNPPHWPIVLKRVYALLLSFQHEKCWWQRKKTHAYMSFKKLIRLLLHAISISIDVRGGGGGCSPPPPPPMELFNWRNSGEKQLIFGQNH